MNHPLRCRCGKVQGFVVPSPAATRAICYCEDCQAFARFLRTPGVVDGCGGTEVVASLPKHVQFTGGQEVLACMSLSQRGLLRWYAACCNTPIGNTPRNSKISYVGLVHNCLEGGSPRAGSRPGDSPGADSPHRDSRRINSSAAPSPSLESSFGPLRMVVNSKSALCKVRSTPGANIIGMLILAKALVGARLFGAYKDNPFFAPNSGTPIREPHVLTEAEREEAYRAEA